MAVDQREQESDATALARLPDRLRLPLRFDPAALVADLARLTGETWTPHFVQQNYQGDWAVLPLRAPAGATHPIMRAVSHPGITEWADTELLELCPAFTAVVASLHCPLEAVRLMRLTPGSRILEHRDLDLLAECGQVRLHVPVTTNPGVGFFVNGEPVTMAPGELWYLRLVDPHRVINAGETDRVHLVIDARVNPWLARLLRAAADPLG